MKKFLMVFTICFAFFAGYSNVMANGEGIMDDNAQAQDGPGSGHGSCPNGLCAWNNGNEMAVEVSIVYVDDSGRDVYHTEVWTNNPASNGKMTSDGNVMKYVPNLPSGGDDDNGGYQAVSQFIDSYFLGNNGANALDWYNKYANPDLGTQDANSSNPAQLGTRIISTPVLSFMDHGERNYLTVKEVATRFSELTNKNNINWIANLFNTEYDDVGIKNMLSAGLSRESLALLTASLNSGFGYNIIDFLKGLDVSRKIVVQKTCPGGSMNVSGEIGNCTATKGGNVYSFNNSAGGGSRSDIHRVYGKEKAPVGTYCALYCQEHGTATLPGATGEALALGSYIIWPTSDRNFNNTKFQKDYYPLKFTGTLYCKLGVQPDSNLPGSNGECFNDPVAKYKTHYKTLKENKDRKDYSGKTFEDVRKEYTKKSPEMCDSNYNMHDGNTSCNKKIKKDGCKMGHNGNICPCYNDLDQGLDGEYAELAELDKKLRKAQQDYENAGSKSSCPNKKDGTDPCASAAAAVKSAKAAYDKQESIIRDIKSMMSEINGNKETCIKYTEAFKGSCTILHNMRRCGLYQVSTSVYDFSSSVNMSWSDEEYNTGNVEKISSNKTITKQGAVIDTILEGERISDVDEIIGYPPDTFSEDVDDIKENEYEVTATDIYSLKTGYSYIDKDTLKYKKSKSELTNYIDMSAEENSVKSVIPTSYNNKVGKNYYLKLTDIEFGSSMSNFSASEYKCKQTFTKSSDVCVCPENTKHAGKNLMPYIRNNKKTCLDAQLEYCDTDNPTLPCIPGEPECPGEPGSGCNPEKENCDYCNPPMDNISITSCIMSGHTARECKQKICPDIKEPIKCKNTNGVGGKMDITSCVETKMMQGKTKQQAIDVCDALICPLGKFIIYRTIKLENPFPGKEISRIAEGFNNEVVGRYPGYNWNSITAVRSKIRKNRDTSGTTIYQTREPLYRFILNGTNIEKIRSYNKQQKEGYNDFTLECKQNKSAGCISYVFVHKPSLSGLVSGTCQNIGLDNGFYTCVNNLNKAS